MSSFPRLGRKLPANSAAAVDAASEDNPRVKAAQSDVDAATAALRGARANYFPKLGVEGSVRKGIDIDGTPDWATDGQVKLVSRWNLYAGGADVANEHAQAQRVAEAKMRLESARREVREALAAAWNNRRRQGELADLLKSQAVHGKDVVALYDEQFKAGRRTLLDVLSAQNNYFNALVLAETALHSRDLAEYRVLAASGRLVSALGVAAPKAHSGADDRLLGWHTTVTRP